MNSTRVKVTLIIFSVLIIFGTTGVIALSAYYKTIQLNTDVRQSAVLRSKVEQLVSEKYKQPLQDELQTIRNGLKPEERQLALSNVIQAYTSENEKLFKNRIREFHTIENQYVDYLVPQVQFQEQRVIYFSAIGISSLLIGLLFLFYFLRVQIFSPLHEISTQMIGFLNGQYSYRFSVPSQTEVGELQATFHAMAQRVLQNMEELKTLDTAKSEFLNIASHELRTPMTSIKGSLGLLTGGVVGQLDTDSLTLMRIAEDETDRLIRLINDILDMAKIEAGKMPLAPKWTHMNQIIEQCANSLHGLSETAGVAIFVDPMPSIEVLADKDRIQQVLTNLLSNAIKFSPRNGFVRIKASIDNRQQVLIEVIDKGRGISPEDQAQIFQKFRQATSSDNPLVKGTGLGLAIAKALIDEHNGRIGVTSQPGIGSTFYFSLPKWRIAAASAEEEVPTRGVA